MAPTSPSRFERLRDDLMAAFLEYIGTTVFLLLAFGGVQAATGETDMSPSQTSETSHVLYISLCFGFSLLVSAWLFFRVTGGLFNPNVSLALLLCGVITPVRFVLYCIAQLVGGITAAALTLALTPGPLAANTVLQQGINPAQGVFIEMFTTSILVLSVLMLAAEKHNTTPFAPVGIGLTLFICELFAVYYTGGALNTARAFGPAVVTGFPNGTHWVYWLGPGLGALLAAFFYMILKHYHYWRLNPGQDIVDPRESPPDPLENAKTALRRSTSRGSGARTSPAASRRALPDAGVQEGAEGAGQRPNDSAV